jgi:hypothetical protein
MVWHYHSELEVRVKKTDHQDEKLYNKAWADAYLKKRKNTSRTTWEELICRIRRAQFSGTENRVEKFT